MPLFTQRPGITASVFQIQTNFWSVNFCLLPPYYKLYKFRRSTHTHDNFKDFCQSPVNRMAASMKQKKKNGWQGDEFWASQWSPTFLTLGTGFMEDSFSMDRVVREGFRMIQEHYTCALYYFYISSTSDHQTLDPRDRTPILGDRM